MNTQAGVYGFRTNECISGFVEADNEAEAREVIADMLLVGERLEEIWYVPDSGDLTVWDVV